MPRSIGQLHLNRGRRVDELEPELREAIVLVFANKQVRTYLTLLSTPLSCASGTLPHMYRANAC